MSKQKQSRRSFARSLLCVSSVSGVLSGTGFNLAAAAEPEIDLLPHIALPRDALRGTWEKAGAVVVFCGDAEFAKLVLPSAVPQAYRLSLTVTRETGDQIFVLGLIAGAKTTAVLLDGWGGGISGIDKIDGRHGDSNASTHRGFRFRNGIPTRIECTVEAGQISVSCDGQQVINWRGDFSALSSVEGWMVPGGQSLFVGGWKPSRLRIDELTLQPLAAGQTPLVRERPRTALAPPPGKCLLCIGEDAPALEEYVHNTKHVPAGFMVRTHLGAWGDQVMGIDRLELDGVQDFTVVKNHPNTVLQVGLVFAECQADVVGGKYDDKVRRLATWFRDAGIPVYLRVGVEFNHPGDALQFRHEPNGYKKAFARIRSIIEEAGATNVRYVWHAFTDPRPQEMQRVFEWYPGDDLVDWFGVSIYNDNPAVLPAILASSKWLADEAQRHGKPFMIAEAGVRGGNAQWGRFSLPLFKFIKDNNVAMLCLISEDLERRPNYRGKGWGDMRAHAPPALPIWLRQVKKEGFLLGTDDLYRTIGFR
jgi:hypothetical protein